MRGLLTRLVAFALVLAPAAATLAGGPVPEGAGSTVAVEEAGLVATLHLPPGEAAHPGVLVVGGSGGGIDWQEGRAALLAEHGFAALALAYFGMPGLPSDLDRIPLEYFERALGFLRGHPRVEGERIGLLGVSKGGELALLLASEQPAVGAVAAYVPSSVVFQSIAPGWPVTSSWTRGGEEVPFVPYRTEGWTSQQPLAELYRLSLEQTERVEAARIPVERIQGPILLLSGRDDTLWPSTAMSEAVVARLAAHDFPFPYEHVAYPDAGHLISSPREDSTKLGGTLTGNRRAQEDAERRMLAFFREHLQPARPNGP